MPLHGEESYIFLYTVAYMEPEMYVYILLNEKVPLENRVLGVQGTPLEKQRVAGIDSVIPCLGYTYLFGRERRNRVYVNLGKRHSCNLTKG
jgi:hypothetical protein